MATKMKLAAVMIAALGVSACGSLPTYARKTETIPAEQAAQQEANREVKSRALYLRLVEEMQADNKHRAAIAYLDEYNQAYPGEDIAAILRGKSLVALEQYGDAEAVLQPLTTGALADQAYGELGTMWAKRGDWVRAASYFEMAREKAPTRVKYLNNLGYAELMTKRYDRAEQVLKQALELDDDNPSIRNNLILALFLQGKKAQARKIVLSLEGQERDQVIALLKQWNDTVLTGSSK